MSVELYRQGKWPETPEGLQLGIDLACPGPVRPVAGGKAEEGVRLRLHFFREVFGNLAGCRATRTRAAPGRGRR